MSRWVFGAALVCTVALLLGLAGCVATGEGQAGVTLGVGGRGGQGAPGGHPVLPEEPRGSRGSLEDY
jgi:hypothetical protein